MFIKPFKIRSNNPLRRTERKKFCKEILKVFPTLTENDIQNIIRKEDAISLMNVITHCGRMAKIYSASKTPIFIQFDKPEYILCPTVYTLWQYPELLYYFTIHSAVVPNLLRGAHLMLPGLVLDGPPTLKSFGKLAKGTLVAVNTVDNKAAVAVGLTAHSSEDMYMSGGHGKCVEIIHVFGDTLCQLDSLITRPKLDPPKKESNETQNSSERNCEESEEPELIKNVFQDMNNLEINKDENNCTANNKMIQEIVNLEEEEEEMSNVEMEKTPETNPIQEMDKLLEYCFLKACKTSIKMSDLPMLSSNFFKNHVLTACPPGKNLDIKTSSFKKLSAFLLTMKVKGIIDTSIVKGVESLISIKTDHPLLTSFEILDNDSTVETDATNGPVMTICYRVTPNVALVLSQFGFTQGDIMNRDEIRKCFLHYVTKEKLLLENGKMFSLNGPLAQIFQTGANVTVMKYEDGINKFCGKMTVLREIRVGNTKILHGEKVEPIDITVSTRTYGKKVTFINNLEMYGIKLDEFSKECQLIGASSSITEVPGKKTPSVLVQGNQVLYVYKLLTEKYRINKSWIRGLEFAPKKKK